MQRNVLKHQFENFTTAPNESLDKAYDRFQKLISQLEVHAALVYEDEMKRSSSSTSNSQNLAFLSSENTSSTNEVSTASGNFGVNTAGGTSSTSQVSSTPGADEVVCSFSCKQTNQPPLDIGFAADDHVGPWKKLDFRWKGHLFRIATSGKNKDQVDERDLSPAIDRFSKADGYHVVPPPITWNFLTSRADISFAGKTNEVIIKKPKSVHESVVPKPKINRDKVIIEDWNSDDEDDVSAVKTVSPVKTNETQTVEERVLTRTRPSVSTFRPVCTARLSVSTARPSVSTARLVCTTRPSVSTARPIYATRPIYLRMDNVRPRGSYSSIKRSYYTKLAFRPKDLKQDVKTFGVQNMTTAGTRAVVNTGKGKMDTGLKKSRWVWRPKGNYLDHVSKDSGSFMLKKFEYVDPKGISKSIMAWDHAVVDSGCSNHMTGNKAYLSDYEDSNGGFVAFGSDPKGALSFLMKVNRAPRKDDMYSKDLKNIVPSRGITCLYANATADESKLWHRRLGHVNFKNINKLVKGHLVRGLPLKVFVNDHTCVTCKKGKQHKASCKAKSERIIRKPLELLHMDLFRPVFIESINKKRYCLVVTDDFSRFSWVFFLATKDETSEILCKFIIGLENQLNHNVKIIRCDNGTEFKNHAMNEFCAKKGIKREFSVARTPQQNGVAERKNRTLIEAARTMLADSLLPIPFWAEAVNTACYVLNRVLVTKPQNKTPYELLIGKPLDIQQKNQERVEENLHINFLFLEDQPMNMELVQLDDHQEKLMTDSRYILLPLQPHRTRIPIEDVALAAHENPSEKVIAKALDDATRQAFEEEKRNIAFQKKAAQVTSTNKLSTVRSQIPDLEDAFDTLLNDGIFNGAYDDDEDVGAVAEFNNMDNTIAVSPIPTLKIHNDHPKGQILGDTTSGVQIRGKIQKASSAQ
ncbi:putative ribonuclease H-like domain-containing protein [Tanacetum coccineum]